MLPGQVAPRRNFGVLYTWNAPWKNRQIGTGKLGGFRRDLGGATAVKLKDRGGKSDPGVDSRAARGTKMNLTQRADSRAAKTHAGMYMYNQLQLFFFDLW